MSFRVSIYIHFFFIIFVYIFIFCLPNKLYIIIIIIMYPTLCVRVSSLISLMLFTQVLIRCQFARQWRCHLNGRHRTRRLASNVAVNAGSIIPSRVDVFFFKPKNGLFFGFFCKKYWFFYVLNNSH